LLPVLGFLFILIFNLPEVLLLGLIVIPTKE
jgi:predicted Na+-dependent transporter